jgi:hypothetical protein
MLFNQIAAVENAYNSSGQNIDQEELIAVVFDRAPKDYKAVLTAEQRLKGNVLTLNDLEDAMNAYFRTFDERTNRRMNMKYLLQLSLVCAIIAKGKATWPRTAERRKVMLIAAKETLTVDLLRT